MNKKKQDKWYNAPVCLMVLGVVVFVFTVFGYCTLTENCGDQPQDEDCGIGCAIAESKQQESNWVSESIGNMMTYLDVNFTEAVDLYKNKSSKVHDFNCSVNHCSIMWSDGRCLLMSEEYLDCVTNHEP